MFDLKKRISKKNRYYNYYKIWKETQALLTFIQIRKTVRLPAINVAFIYLPLKRQIAVELIARIAEEWTVFAPRVLIRHERKYDV